MPSTFVWKILVPVISAVLVTTPLSSSYAQTAPTEQISKIFGMSLAPADTASGSENLFIATKYGLLRAEPIGVASLVTGLQASLTSLAVDPENPNILLTSGYGSDGKKLGVMKSSDGGQSWNRISRDTDSPVALRAMDISRVDGNIMYGIFEQLQVSRDAGQTWQAGAKLPENVFSLAASSISADTLYMAANQGLLVSRDGGEKWQQTYQSDRPATMIRSAGGGRLYAFIYGIGLITAQEPGLDWQVLSGDFDDRYILNLALDPGDPNRLYATVDTGAILISSDGGKSWNSFEGSHTASAENVAKGKVIYQDICQACHGENGIGEVPDDPAAKDEFGFKAPALNDDTHAWHHSDKNLAESITKGSPRNERMVAFKEILSAQDVENVITYVKSLWSIRSLSCQGGRHMSCLNQGN